MTFHADRKKDLVKLQAGEYVSLGKVESELKICPIVDNICVYGESSKLFVVALIVPNQNHLQEIANALGISENDFEKLCSMPQIEKAVVKELADYGSKCKYITYNTSHPVQMPRNRLLTDCLIQANYKKPKYQLQWPCAKKSGHRNQA